MKKIKFTGEVAFWTGFILGLLTWMALAGLSLYFEWHWSFKVGSMVMLVLQCISAEKKDDAFGRTGIQDANRFWVLVAGLIFNLIVFAGYVLAAFFLAIFELYQRLRR